MCHKITTQDIGIIILAAGSSVRFGSDKRLATLNNGQTILETTLGRIPETFTQRLLVLKAGDEKLAEKFEGQWKICFSRNPEKGLASSLGSAIAQTKNWQGAFIGLADMPFIASPTYSMLQEALTRHEIVVPVHNERRGNPVGFRKRFFTEIENLTGDQGAKALLKKYSGDICELDTGDAGIFKDIDKPEMLT